MAVIKIVPMPGAKGDKGDEGATGAQGPQGPIGATGPAGADAAWYYNGEYNPGASYVVGDVVTYDGQTWYRKHANGGNVGDTPSVGPFWDLIASKGTDASSFISSGTWDTEFLSQSGLEGSFQHPDRSFGKYTKIGDLVFFEVSIYGPFITNWGSSIGWKFKLPFKAAPQWQTGVNPLLSKDFAVGRFFGNKDTSQTTLEPNSYGWIPLFGVISSNLLNESHCYLFAQDVQDIHTLYDSLKPISSTWPWDFTQPESDYIRFHITGTYMAES